MNPIDKVVSWISPNAGAKRIYSRYRLGILREELRKYDAASNGRRTSGWRAGGGSANAEIGGGLAVLRNRSRELVRNNSFAKKAVAALNSNVIGSGILAKPNGPNAAENARVGDLWKRWALTPEIDSTGKMDFHGLQSLGFRSAVEGGEHLIQRHRRRTSEGLAVPLQLQLLEPDHIDTNKTEDLAGGDRIVQGIQFAPSGRPRRYWLFPDHPGEPGFFKTSGRFRSDPVEASRLLHPFNVERIGQVRGIPWGASCLIRLRDFDDYADAQLVRQKLAACYVAFVHDSAAGGTNTVGATVPSPIPEEFTPGMVEQLPAGKDIAFSNPPQIEGYTEYAKVTLQEIAAGYGVTYEQLTGDLSGVNFSSGRMGWIEHFRSIIQWRAFIMKPQVCDPVWRWFNEALVAMGEISEPIAATWTPPRREMIDPVKEVKALTEMVRSGFSSLSEAIRQLGYDPRELLEELRDDQALLEELGLTLDSIGAKAGETPAAMTAEGLKAIEDEAADDDEVRADAASGA